jgi:phosphoadenosine phosphosulfate reductase
MLALSPPVPAVHDAEAPAAKAERLNHLLRHALPAEIVLAAIQSVSPGRIAVVSSFGTESAVLLKFVADVDPSVPVLFLNTGWLFKETLIYRDTLASHLGLTDVRSLIPSPSAVATSDPRGELCFLDHDACCEIRKVAPLAAALASFDAWMNGRKRYQSDDRSSLPVVELDGGRLKFNPLARLSRADIEAVFENARLPRHPLERVGFSSVGCVPCTSRGSGRAARDGRWSGLAKTECGIHTRALQRAAGK